MVVALFDLHHMVNFDLVEHDQITNVMNLPHTNNEAQNIKKNNRLQQRKKKFVLTTHEQKSK